MPQKEAADKLAKSEGFNNRVAQIVKAGNFVNFGIVYGSSEEKFIRYFVYPAKVLLGLQKMKLMP